MKTRQILATVFALVTLFSFQAMATGKGGGGKSADAKFAYSLRPVQNTDKIVLSFDNAMREKVTIKIYDAANQLVFKQVQQATAKLRQSYDLSNLKDGNYTVKIESEKFSFTEDIEIGKNWNTLDFEAVIAADSNDDNRLRIGFANAKGNVKIEITDAAGNTVHSETYSDQYGNEIFNMDDLKSGEYTVTVYSNGDSFSETYIVE